MLIRTLLATLLILYSTNLKADIYKDSLRACFVNAATEEDRVLLIKWMFSAISAHPEMASLASVTPQEKEKINQDVARLFFRLLDQSCATETQKVVEQDGRQAINQSMDSLGQLAGQAIFSHPKVLAELSKFKVYLPDSE
ncbi:hypothetical protein AAOGI_32590 [Agarivorans albus]|uniref:hypothetical protein n=1 Tax=Agarivorans sp. JK6 TaxID=2997426 RepID=UPI0037E6E76E